MILGPVENGHETTELGLSRRARNRLLVNVTRGRFAFFMTCFMSYLSTLSFFYLLI